MSISSTVFSEYEITKIGIKLDGVEKADINECVGSWEEELEVKTVTKKCRGKVSKTRTRGTGGGTIKASLHIAQDLFADLYNMKGDKGLAEGVIGYGTPSLHPTFCVTCLVKDEDDNEKYKAYPKCTIQSPLSRAVENGAEEVSEVELELAIMPDDAGNGMYEALKKDIDEATAKQWMESWSDALVHPQTTTAAAAE